MIDTHLLLNRRPTNKRGQTLVEYALILAFISVVAISTLLAMGGQVKGVFTTVSSQLALANNGGSSSSGSGSGGSGGSGGSSGGGGGIHGGGG